MKALVTHPGLQHAHQLAWALEQAGHLQGFWSGVPVSDIGTSKRFVLWRTDANRQVLIPAQKRRHYRVFPAARQIASRLVPSHQISDWHHRIDHCYDAFVARRIGGLNPELVVCYENSALRTFRAAKAMGAVCVLDAASVHYQASDRWLADMGDGKSVWINEQKQQEIELADAILTCSEFAAETYRTAGVKGDKVFPVPLGTNLYDLPLPIKVSGGPCRFVFVGTLRRLKSVDILLDIFDQMTGGSATLTLIGSSAEYGFVERALRMSNVQYLPHIPHPQLFEEVAKHDVLVLPSRFDSFGMVVPEAMGVAVPALVSDRVGAKCIIEQHPAAGWIVPCEAGALRAKMLELVADRQQIARASLAARRAVLNYSWSAYRFRAAQAVEEIFARFRGAAA